MLRLLPRLQRSRQGQRRKGLRLGPQLAIKPLLLLLLPVGKLLLLRLLGCLLLRLQRLPSGNCLPRHLLLTLWLLLLLLRVLLPLLPLLLWRRRWWRLFLPQPPPALHSMLLLAWLGVRLGCL